MIQTSDLYVLIRQTAKEAFAAGDYQAVTDALNAKVIPKTDNTPRDSNWIINQLSGADADTVLGTLQTSSVPRVAAAVAKLAGTGIDLSSPHVQEMVPQLGAAAEWSRELIETVLGWGVWAESPVEDRFGRGVVVTIEQVQAAAEWSSLHDRLRVNYNTAVAGLDNKEITDWDGVMAAMAAPLQED